MCNITFRDIRFKVAILTIALLKFIENTCNLGKVTAQRFNSFFILDSNISA